MTDEEKQWEKLKELGNEYRYRDQLMVQEFTFTIMAAAILLQALSRYENSPEVYKIIQILSGVFLGILAFHLNHINRDRVATLDAIKLLRDELEVTQVHKGVGHPWRSAPRLMKWFTAISAILWLGWAIFPLILSFLYCLTNCCGCKFLK